ITNPGPTQPSNSINLNGHTVGGNFYPVFQNYQGTLGNPISDVTNYNGASYQKFENGSIVSSQYGTFPLYGGIRQTFLKNGGLEGWLGEPKSGEKGLGNGNILQYFEDGYIYWNGSKATAYRYGTTLPKTPTNIGNQLGVTMPNFNLPAYRENNIFWQSGYAPASTNPSSTNLGSALGNCTWYVNGRLQQLGYNTTALNKLRGNANEWDNQAAAAGIFMSKDAQVGDIAQWENGHVAVVEKVNPGGTILISQSSYTPNSGSAADYLYKTETISASSPSQFIRVPSSGSSSPGNLGGFGDLGINTIGVTPIDDGSLDIGQYKKAQLKNFSGSETISNIPTWVIVHGFQNNSYNEVPQKLLSGVKEYSADAQIFLLDWGEVAKNKDVDKAAAWIDEVGKAAGEKLNSWGITTGNINIIGHSLGSYVAAEIAKNVKGGVNDIVALDPASTIAFNGSYKGSDVKFSDNSSWAWGFYSSFLGDLDRAKTAEESFNVEFPEIVAGDWWKNEEAKHGAVVDLFVSMLKEAKDKTVSSNGDIFGLDRMNSSGKPWNIDYGNQWEAKLIPQKKGDNSWVLKDVVPY
ncbi:CHAP domain-containing protein, partial [Microcoleus sp. A2-C5]